VRERLEVRGCVYADGVSIDISILHGGLGLWFCKSLLFSPLLSLRTLLIQTGVNSVSCFA
jgi:hypothetical protein